MYPESWDKHNLLGEGARLRLALRATSNVGLSSPSSLSPSVVDSDQPIPEPEDTDHDDMMHPIREAMLNLLASMCWSGLVEPLIEIRWAHPCSSLMLCCSCYPRPFTTVSPKVDTTASPVHDDVIFSQITKEFIKQDLISFSPFCSLMDKVQIKKQLLILAERGQM